jgi:pyridoxamine 5'-phosphate oxidase
MSTRELASIRREYGQRPLTRASLQTEPLAQLELWLEEAIVAQANEPTAMLVASVDAQGCPDTRWVLLKNIVEEQLIFYSNYQSRKAEQFAANSHVALNFYWPELSRQVRLRGLVSQVAPELSDHYFAGRPRGSQLSALLSPQSQVVESRQFLEEQYRQLDTQWQDKTIPRPTSWGGYQVQVNEYEFWQGRDNRLHDRFRYTREGQDWSVERLAP